jgi:hypothetical protein
LTYFAKFWKLLPQFGYHNFTKFKKKNPNYLQPLKFECIDLIQRIFLKLRNNFFFPDYYVEENLNEEKERKKQININKKLKLYSFKTK